MCMYLQLDNPEYDEWPFYDHRPLYPTYWWFPLSDDGYTLVYRWCHTIYDEDQVVSGVLADYLDENRDYLLSGATGPSDPAVRLDRLIGWLRRRCTHPAEVRP